MSTTLPPVEAAPPASPGPSPGVRTLRVFARPFQAWEGLEVRAQWWFPMVLMCILTVVLTVAMYDSVMIPTSLESMRPRIEAGQISADQAEAYVRAPMMRAITIGITGIGTAVMPLLVALEVWFGIGFILGGKFRYRLALEVASWSALVTLPAAVLKFALSAWQGVSVNYVHLGLGALLPMSDPPGKLQLASAVMLDAIGPFSVWLLFVQVVGCSALSGLRAKNVAWVLTALYLALTLVGAIVTYLFAPGT